MKRFELRNHSILVSSLILCSQFIFLGQASARGGLWTRINACIQARQGPSQRYETGQCQLNNPDQHYDRCVLDGLAALWQQSIQSTLEQECNVALLVRTQQRDYEEQIEAQRRQYEAQRQERQNIINQGYMAPPLDPPAQIQPPQFTGEQLQVMHRLYPEEFGDPGAPGIDGGPAAGAQAFRTDSCFEEYIRTELTARADTICDTNRLGEGGSTALTCQVADSKAEAAKNMRDNVDGLAFRLTPQVAEITGYDVEDSRSQEERGPIENMKIVQANIAIALKELQDANQDCAQAITSQSAQCMPLFSEFFLDQSRADLVGKYCTHEALIRDVENIHKYVGRARGPAANFRGLSEKHIANRQEEQLTAAHLINVTSDLAKLERLNRDPASEGE